MNAPATAPLPPPRPEDGLDPCDPSLWPDVTQLVTEDDTPVESPLAEKQMRLLTEPLYTSWPGPADGKPFRVLANVGLYNTPNKPPIVPDVMLGLGVRTPENLMVKGNRSWFTWLVGKPPDVAIEIVSDREGGEDSTKLVDYAEIRVSYYVIYDPRDMLGHGVLRGFALHEGRFVAIDPRWLPNVELGLVLWSGKYEDVEEQWLRWCDAKGQVIPTGAERSAWEESARQQVEAALQQAETARQQAEAARQAAEERAAHLAEKLRSLGADPSA